MKRTSRLIALIMAALLLGGVVFSIAYYALAETAYTPYDAPLTARSRGDNVYVRKSADPSDAAENIVVKLRGMRGKDVSVLGESGDFYYIRHADGEGFVFKSDFKLRAPTPTATAGAQSTPQPTPRPVSTPQPPREEESLSQSTDAAGGSSDVWGSIAIPGYKTYKIYCNARNSAGTDYYYNKDYNHIFAMTPQGAQVAVIMGHNMRKSGTMFHALHHVQNAWLGKAKCERCGKSCGSAFKASNFKIKYDGYKDWALVCFYETEKEEPSSTLSHNALGTGSPSSWLSYQLGRAEAGGKGMVVSSATDADKLMILITCGDKIGGSTGARLYMVLKAVG